ncbi:MAG TPA: class I SAM-dependent methyltransferase [Bacteroidales bacterium]|nr:class I SAM-dependent methyltransferase [Bacteroidales bacterium]HPT03323.1 class I SAM-dependent methyltransferase [Bacteroidales bacterium]
MMQLLTPRHWRDYELIDSGGLEKIERFGKFILIRPEPQALWDRSMSREEWQGLSHAEFRKEKNDPEKGKWILKRGTPEQWEIGYANGEMKLRMRLGLTAFRHIGVFPEQAENWDFIFNTIGSFPKPSPRVLNLFAYTGGASLAARAAGADVLHLDSVKPVVTWARENMELSRLDGIRWIVEDALKFVQREVRRGSKYSGIILDPPAYGRGPEGEKWIIDDGLPEMIKHCNQLLEPENSFLILNMYSIGFSALVADNLINSCFSKTGNKEYGELYLSDKFSKRLPLGTFLRFVR